MKGKTLSALMCAGLMAPGFAFAQGFGDGTRGNEDAEMQQRRQDPGRLHPQDQGQERQQEQPVGQQDQQQQQPGALEQAGDAQPGKEDQQQQAGKKMDQEQPGEVGGISLEDYQQQQADGQQQQQPRFLNVKGKLVDLKASNIKGQGEHLLAKLETEQGKTIVLDLGKLSDLEQQGMTPKQFQRIEARGTPGRLNQRPILIVDRYLGDGEATVFVLRDLDAQQQQGQVVQEGQRQQQGERTLEAGAPREDRQQQRQEGGFFEEQGPQQQRQDMGQQQKQQPRTVLLRGRLIETRDVQLQGISDEHRLAKLRTRSGRTAIVDLGTKDQLEDIKLSNGEWIAVTGQLGRINGKPVVFATHVADIATIDREGQSLDASMERGNQRSRQQDEEQREER